MKSAAIVAALFPVLALAGPVKRDVVTVWQTRTTVIWVTVDPTPSPSQSVDTAAMVEPTTTSATVNDLPTSTSTSSLSTSSSPSWNEWNDGTDYSRLSPYAAPILKQHNIHRENHTVPAMRWDDELASLAKEIADTCIYAHSNKAGNGEYGQNIGAGAPDRDVPKLITNNMYNGEINDYPGYDGEPEMTNFHAWGHFSQIVWKNTTNVGCHTTKCDTLRNTGSGIAPYFTVCNYRPMGNFGGQYRDNVLKPIGRQSVVLP